MNAIPNTKKNTDEPLVLNLEGAKRKRFLINGDPNKVLAINTTDINILDRIRIYYPKLQELGEKVSAINTDGLSIDDEDSFNLDSVSEITEKLKECDAEMRKYLDLLFDANVSEVCDCGGTMYDPINGQLRFESLITDIASVYDNDFTAEIKKLDRARKSHTAKYTKKKK